MSRTRIVTWVYECDALRVSPDDIPHAGVSVDRGAHLSTGRGTVIREQADADAWVRLQGWTVSAKRTVCPSCVEAGR